MRGAPRKGFAWLMRRIRSRMFEATSGLSGRRRDGVERCGKLNPLIPLSHGRRKLCGANGGPCRAEPSADIAANRTRIATTQPTRIGRSGGSASDAGRSFGEPPVGDQARGSPPAGPHGVRKLEATKAKRAAKRELIVVATMISRLIGTSLFSDRTEFSVTTGPGIYVVRCSKELFSVIRAPPAASCAG